MQIPERHHDRMISMLDTDDPSAAIEYYKKSGAADLSPDGMLAGWHKARLYFKYADPERRRKSWAWLKKRNMHGLFGLPLGKSFEDYINKGE